MGKNYSHLKIFHFGAKLEDLKQGRISAPLHVRLKPKNLCNHSCSYCCYRTNKLFMSELFQEADEIPWPKMQELVGDFREMGVKAVTFSGGGEPLSYSYIFETIELLRDAGIKVATLTNGTYLEGRVAQILGETASWVRVSMDAANAKDYSIIRRVDLNEFDKICKNIEAFAKTKKKNCELGINFILTKRCHKDVYKFLKLMKELGINHVKVNECVVTTNGSENRRYYNDIEQTVRDQIAQAVKDLADSSFGIVDQFCHSTEEETGYKKPYSLCPMIQSLTVVAADLNVYTCQDKAYTTDGKIGTIKDKTFKELWYSEETAKMLKSLNPSLECNHHCTQHAKNLELLEFMDVSASSLEFV